MPRIFAIGETVLDIIFENDIPVSSCVGGSMLNSAVSLGRMNMPVYMITGYAKDQPGRMADKFLKQNGVDITMVNHYPDGKTTIALAFLDEAKIASYQFYQDMPSNQDEFTLPKLDTGDLLLFGSVFSLRQSMRPYFIQLLNLARIAGVCAIYDPNFRTAHLVDLDILKPAILENMSYASIIRGSNEDFEHIFGLNDPDSIYSLVSQFCPNLIITRGPEETILFTSGFRKRYSVPHVAVISTIGAGDSFNAGLLMALFNRRTNNTLESLSEYAWDEIIGSGIACASAACSSRENYVPVNFNPRFI
jgi:fructokinase